MDKLIFAGIDEAIRAVKSECYMNNPLDIDRTILVNRSLDLLIEIAKMVKENEMSEQNNTKEVYFSEWCNKCKYAEAEEWKDPCNTCLAEPYNYDTHKPTKYEEAK